MSSFFPIKHNEEALAYLASIVESSDDAIVGKTLDGTIISWNQSAERIFGYTPEEAIGRHISLIISEDRLDEEFVIIGKIKAGQRVDHFETRRRAKDGRMIDLSLTVSPIRNAAGEIIGASKIARDITLQKETQKQLQILTQRKEEFLATVSHELRTPLNVIVGIANILGMSKNIENKEKQYVTALKESADNLLRLINNLLDSSRLESGAFESEDIEFNVQDTIEKTINLLNIKADAKHLGLTIHFSLPMKKYAVGDTLRLQQILTNLVDNAIKFTDQGGIRVDVRVTEVQNGQNLVISVKDTGIGIPPEKIGSIFEKFVQADASTTRKYGGSGLGLAICKSLAEKVGGCIEAQSTPGVGSTFTLTLPIQPAPRDDLITVDAPAPTERKNVLVVEDYAPNLMVVTAMLDDIGYTYDTAENGLQAVRKFQQGLYDVILMDVQMHEMDGIESTRRIRLLEKAQDRAPIPIIAMTAHVLEKDKNLCLEAGMNDFIPKPFEHGMLVDKLARAIEKS